MAIDTAAGAGKLPFFFLVLTDEHTAELGFDVTDVVDALQGVYDFM